MVFPKCDYCIRVAVEMGVNYDTSNRIDFQNFHQIKKASWLCVSCIDAYITL